VSIVIPARNEERAIGASLDAALKLDYPRFEVVVVDDCSTDGTAAEIQARAHDGRLTPVSGEPPPPGWLGKPHALAMGASKARGDWLLFMDADVRLDPRTLRDAVSYVEQKRLDHLALFPHFERLGFWEEVLVPFIAQSGFSYIPSFLARSPRLRRVALGAGAFNFVRRAAYHAVGGHEAIKASVVDDVRLAMELKRAGFRSLLEMGDHLVRLRMYHGRAEFVRGFTKNMHAVLQSAVSRHWILVGSFLLVGQLPHVLPFVFAYRGGLWAASLALLLASRALLQWRLSYPLWPALFHPIQVAVMAEIEMRSLSMAHGEGVVRWRGREYRRDKTTF